MQLRFSLRVFPHRDRQCRRKTVSEKVNMKIQHRTMIQSRIANQAAWERGSKIGNSRKWLREGAKGLLDSGSEKSLALVQNRVAPVQNRFRKVQETLGRPLLPGCERPFAPSRNHFGEFPIFDPLSQAAWFASQECQPGGPTYPPNLPMRAAKRNSILEKQNLLQLTALHPSSHKAFVL